MEKSNKVQFIIPIEEILAKFSIDLTKMPSVWYSSIKESLMVEIEGEKDENTQVNIQTN